MSRVLDEVPLAASGDRVAVVAPPADRTKDAAVSAGRRGGTKSGLDRPQADAAAARRKAALHALRYAFAADVTEEDADPGERAHAPP